MSVKRAFCILFAGFLIFASGCGCDYTRVCRVRQSSDGGQVLIDTFGEMWEVLDELPDGAEVEITLREGGILDEYFDDRIVEVRVLYVPGETEVEKETVVAPLSTY